MPEFAPHVLDTLRQPLEDGTVTIARAAGSVRFPAEIQIVGAMNPCRRACRSLEACQCTPPERARYLGRLSSPLLDRIDLQVEVRSVPYRELAREQTPAGTDEESGAIRRRVTEARGRQWARLARSPIRASPRINSRMTPRQVGRHCRLSPEGRRLLGRAVDQLGLSARAHDRVLKVARTIADLAGVEDIVVEHLAEALQYRILDRGPG